jgi:hypothetical protein
MTTQTIDYVNPLPRTWEGPNGTIEFISGTFAGGDAWSLGCKPDNLTDRLRTFEDLVGVESDYELEAKDDYNGVPQWKLKSWPGKPVYGGSGGSGPRDERGMAIGAAGHDAAVLVAAAATSGVPIDVLLLEYEGTTKAIYEFNQTLKASPAAPSPIGDGSKIAQDVRVSRPSTSDTPAHAENAVAAGEQSTAKSGGSGGGRRMGKTAAASAPSDLWDGEKTL